MAVLTAMTLNKKKNHGLPESVQRGASGSRTHISGPVLDRLIKEKMARTPECDGIAALPVLPVERQAGAWRVPGYVGDVTRIGKCEATIREYLEFLATQFDLADD
jgi:hypothetical protein